MTFTKHRVDSDAGVRESYVLRVPGRGAVEMWRMKTMGYEFGGIEVHSSHETEYGVEIPGCQVLGGKCWTDGSSLAFEDNKHMWGNPTAVKLLLKDWSGRYLNASLSGGGDYEQPELPLVQ